MGGEITKGREPGVLDTMVENVNCVLEQDAVWPKHGNHVEKCELV